MKKAPSLVWEHQGPQRGRGGTILRASAGLAPKKKEHEKAQAVIAHKSKSIAVRGKKEINGGASQVSGPCVREELLSSFFSIAFVWYVLEAVRRLLPI